MIEKLFENLSIEIWNRIRDTYKASIRQGEETITDIILLEILRLKSSNVQVIQTPKIKEKEKGTDWEWWIGSKNEGYLRYAIQSKKIDPESRNYKSLNYKSGKGANRKRQIDILTEYAKDNNAIPLYCFYNYVELKDGQDLLEYWHHKINEYQIEQFGWTYTPVDNVLKLLDSKINGNKKFHNIHINKDTLPLRYLLNQKTCKKLLNSCKEKTGKGETVSGYIKSLPSFFNEIEWIIEKEKEEERMKRENEGKSQIVYYRDVSDLSIFAGKILTFENNNIIQKATSLPEEYYNHKTALYPKRILKIDIDD